MTDEELEGRFAEVLRRINDTSEGVKDRLTALETRMLNLETGNAMTRQLITGLPKLLIDALEQGFIERIARSEADVRKLKGER